MLNIKSKSLKHSSIKSYFSIFSRKPFWFDWYLYSIQKWVNYDFRLFDLKKLWFYQKFKRKSSKSSKILILFKIRKDSKRVYSAKVKIYKKKNKKNYWNVNSITIKNINIDSFVIWLHTHTHTYTIFLNKIKLLYNRLYN